MRLILIWSARATTHVNLKVNQEASRCYKNRNNLIKITLDMNAIIVYNLSNQRRLLWRSE